MCQSGLRTNCLRFKVVYVPTCQKRANVSFLCANVSINESTCHTTCQCFNLACQHAKRRANFSNISLTKCYRKFLYFIIIQKILDFTYNSYTYAMYMYRKQELYYGLLYYVWNFSFL